MPNGVIGDGARLRRPAILLAAAVLLATCVLASLFVGSSRIPADQVAHYLLHPDASNVSYNINGGVRWCLHR